MYEQSINSIEKILQWFSSVNPAEKLRDFSSTRQHGTGSWIFDKPEYEAWKNSKDLGLWVHGIPGAGKTILSSLVIEDHLSSRPCGTAYFYCRYSDHASQDPLNVLGSFITQLAAQAPAAMLEALGFYSAQGTQSGLSIRPTEEALGSLIESLSLHFRDGVTLLLDGLDECGTSHQRSRLVAVLSSLPGIGFIRVMVFSRAEEDIRECFRGFLDISVAARSTDLQLYVASRVASLNLKEDGLRVEIFEVLTQGAEGM